MLSLRARSTTSVGIATTDPLPSDLRFLGSVVMLAEVRKCSERVAAVGPEDEVKAFAWNCSNLAVLVNVELITAA